MDTRAQDEASGAPNPLISSRRVEGTAVYNPKGERLGTIEQVMIDKLTGQVAYAVMSFGGFLGVGERYHPPPWAVLDYDPARGGYIIDLDKKTLVGAPHYGETSDPNAWTDTTWQDRVDRYYRPYL